MKERLDIANTKETTIHTDCLGQCRKDSKYADNEEYEEYEEYTQRIY